MSILGFTCKILVDNFNKCEFCSQTKITKAPHKSVVRETISLELIHFDLCEFDDVLKRNGQRYFTTMIDDYCGFTYDYFLRYKSEAIKFFKLYVAEVKKINSIEK